MAQFATVAAITGTGTVFAVNAQGASRQLKVGDVLQKGETVRTVGDARVELLMEDGRLLAVAPAQSVRLDENVVESEQRPTAQDSAVTTAATADTIIQALERGTDLSTELEATAAGLTAGTGADGGSSFVQLLRIVEGVDPLSYNYSFTAADVPPDLQTAADLPPDGQTTAIANSSPTILVGDGGLVAVSAVADVYEPALDAGGSNASGLGELVQGKFQVSDPDGVASLVSVTINGTVIPMGSLVGAVVPGASGVLTITSFNPATGFATFTYELTTASTDVAGVDETEIFTFTTTDGVNTSNTATITINIVDDLPTALNDTAAPAEDTAVNIDVFANDAAGADGVNLVTGVAMGSEPTKGVAVYNDDGTFTYTPTAGQDGTDSFTYTITDADGDTSTATVNITLAPDSVPEVEVILAEGDDGVVNEGGLQGGNLGGDIAASGTFQITTGNDSLASLVVGNVDVTAGGTVTGPNGTLQVTNTNGQYSWTYTLSSTSTDVADAAEANSFSVVVTDSDGDTARSTLTVTIADDMPIATTTTIAAITEGSADLSNDATLVFSAGADGMNPSAYAFATPSADNAPTVSGLDTGETLTWAISGSNLVGTTSGGDTITLSLSDATTSTVKVTATLSGNLLHSDTTVNIGGVIVSAADADGDLTTGTVSLSVTDSTPTLIINTGVAVGALAVTEASGGAGNSVTLTAPTYTAGTVDGQTSSVSYALSLASSTATGLVTTAGNHAITLSLSGDGQTISGLYNGSNVAFTVSLSGTTVTLVSNVALEHANTPQGESEDNTLDISALVSVVATVTVTDGDGDVIAQQSTTASPLSLTFNDTDPTVLAISNIYGYNTNQPLNGSYSFNVGADSVGNASTDGVVLTNFTGTTAGGRAITNQTLGWLSEGDTSVTYNFSFNYYPGPTSATPETATGTMVFNKTNGTYTFDLADPIGGQTTFSTSSPSSTVNYDTQGNSSPEIVAQQYSSDFWGVLTARSGPSGNTSGLGTTDVSRGTPNLSYVAGDLLENDFVNYLNVGNATVGVGSDTVQPDALLNFDFYTSNPVAGTGAGATISSSATRAYADAISITIDQLNLGKEDIAILLKLYKVADNSYSTKLLIANNVNDYVLGTDGFYRINITEANYSSLGVGYQIYGVQVVTTTDGLTGSGFSLTGDTSVTLTASGNDLADTSDSDIVKIIKIDVLTSTVSNFDTDLQFNGALIDGDGDSASFSFAVHLEADSAILTGTTGSDYLTGTSLGETINGGGGNDILLGGLGADVFKWSLNDQGGSLTIDRIKDFDSTTNSDKLDLRDLLVGEHSGSTPNIANYLHFTYDSGTNTTTVDVRTSGTGAVNQQIVLENFNATTYGSNDATIIATLIAQGKLDVNI